jgi:hypothetical protein
MGEVLTVYTSTAHSLTAPFLIHTCMQFAEHKTDLTGIDIKATNLTTTFESTILKNGICSEYVLDTKCSTHIT